MKNTAIIAIGFLTLIALVWVLRRSEEDNNTLTLPDTVLSFSGFELGGDFNRAVETARNNKSITSLNDRYDEDLSMASFKTSVPDYLNAADSIPLYVEVEAYKNAIHSISLVSYSSNAEKSIPAMYEAKYGEASPLDHKEWIGEKAVIKLDVSYREKTSKVLDESRVNLQLRNPDNYFKTTTYTVLDEVKVVYEEIALNKTAVEYKQMLKAEREKQVRLEKDRKREEMAAKEAAEEAARKIDQEKVLKSTDF